MAKEWVKVTDILKHVKASIDGFELRDDSEWLRMLRYKSNDAQFATLIRLIESNGFTEPIGIVRYEDFPGYATSYDLEKDGEWLMGNGHHRLTAAILLGMDEILVDFSNTWPTNDMSHDDVDAMTTIDERNDSRWISYQLSDAVIGNEDRELVMV